MNKLLLLLTGMLVCVHAISQEDELVTSGATKINRQLTPNPVIGSLGKTFPGAVPIEYFIIDAGTAKERWTITEDEGNVGWPIISSPLNVRI